MSTKTHENVRKRKMTVNDMKNECPTGFPQNILEQQLLRFQMGNKKETSCFVLQIVILILYSMFPPVLPEE